MRSPDARLKKTGVPEASFKYEIPKYGAQRVRASMKQSAKLFLLFQRRSSLEQESYTGSISLGVWPPAAERQKGGQNDIARTDEAG